LASQPTHFIAGDWGTSSLRLFLCQSDGAILGRVETGDGILSVAEGAFEATLIEKTAAWRARDDLADQQLPVVLSGMIGSRQGWREVAYATCPAGLDDIAAKCAKVPIEDASADLGEIRIVPGLTVRGPDGTPDVMRGEETQIFGALLSSPGLTEQSTFLLPGTHAKWAYVSDGRITSFKTYMTGEVFAALSGHTILGRPTVDAEPVSDDEAKAAFLKGVDGGAAEGGSGALLNRLFAARTRFLFGDLAPGAIGDYLSGLLVGAEIADATGARQATNARPIAIIANATLSQRYALALAHLGHESRRIDPDCVVAAHAQILRR